MHLTKAASDYGKSVTNGKALRLACIGGGCSGLQYSISLEEEPARATDKIINADGLQVFIDQISWMYLNGTELDYVSTLEQSGFVFNNPNVKSTCGCGKSFGT